MKDKLSICIIGGYDNLSKKFFYELSRYSSNTIFINLNKKKITGNRCFNYKIFELKKILSTLKRENIKKIIFLGKINRPNILDFKNDGEIEKYIPILLDSFKKGDGTILSSVISIFKNKGYNVISPFIASKEFFFSKDDLESKINKTDKVDIQKSVKVLNALSKYDNAQSVISVNGYLIAIEAAEGTDDLLKRAAKVRERLDQLKIKSGVLTKIPKKNQSILVDLPVIGPQTIRLIKKANLNGLAIKQKFTMVENKRKTIELIKKFNLRLYNLG